MCTRENRLDIMYKYALSNGLCKNKGKFAELVGVAGSNLSKAFNGDVRYLTDNFLIRVNSVLDNVFSLDWVLNGTLPMMKELHNKQGLGQSALSSCSSEEKQEEQVIGGNGLPLIPIDAVAGFNGVDVQGVRLEDCSRYVVPEFAELHAEYMIRVSGSSMYPKYSNGDLLACRRVTEVTFLQWGKVYVLDSNQGAMVKRLFPCEDNDEVVECRSDNPNYPPFRLPKNEIRSVSIVVGVIRFE